MPRDDDQTPHATRPDSVQQKARFWASYSRLPRLTRRLVLTFVVPAVLFTLLAAVTAALITGAFLRKEAELSIAGRAKAYVEAMIYVAQTLDADFMELVTANFVHAPNISEVRVIIPGLPEMVKYNQGQRSWYAGLSAYDVTIDIPAPGAAAGAPPFGQMVITANFNRADQLTLLLAACSAFFIIAVSATLVLLTLAFLRRNAIQPLAEFVSFVGGPHQSVVEPEGTETEIEAFFRYCKNQVVSVIANESRLSAFVSNVPGIALRTIYGAEGQRLVWISDGVEAILGFPASRFVGPAADLDYRDLFHYEDWKAHRPTVIAAIEDFEPYEVKVRLRTVTGEYKWLLCRGRPMMEVAGEVVTEALLVDIDEQMRKSQALEERERQLSAMVANVAGIATRTRITGNQQQLVWINEGVESFLGIPSWRFVGPRADMKLRDCFHPDDDAAQRPLVLQAIRQFKPYSFKIRVRMANGEYRWMLGRGRPLLDGAGEVIAETLLLDIDEQVKKELWLDAVVTALDSSRDRIFIEDQNRKVVYANRSAKEAAALYSDGLIGRRLNEVFTRTEPHARQLMTQIRKDILTKGFWRDKVKFIRPGGVETIHDVRVAEVAKGGLLFAASDVTEITQRMEREAELQAQLAETQKMESLGHLAGGIAHDFNNILAATRAFADLIIHDTPVGTNANKFAGKIVTACQRAANLVSQILTFSRAQDASREPVSIAEVLNEMRSLLSGRLPPHTRLRSPAIEPDLYITANPGHVTQVILNLAINASDALEGKPGTVTLSSELYCSPAGTQPFSKGCNKTTDGGFFFASAALKSKTDYVRLTCEDNGSGISHAIAFKIFDPFFTTKEKRSGSGLGLAVVNSIVAANEGVITARSVVGKGTTFEIYWPASPPPTQSATGVALPSGERSYTKLTGRERVLVVDDEEDIADALSIGLSRLGYEAAQVYSSADALDVILENPRVWDVIVTDQIMPGLRGLDLIQRVKAVHPSIKAILCTGFNDQSTEQGARERGADLYYMKPAPVSRVAAGIRQLMAGPAKAA